ncbi:hypothetical protein [Chachezhania antarctica]|uniref:hypothetical protein n=1 Tax=Chachezhania antarctica TaxID=2340860 RepID=UPI0019699D38|nr:hypothetical protein [Chachezhania antarctica]
MSQIEDLQGRLTAALNRIGQGLDTMDATSGEGPMKALEKALDEERLANTQLEERLESLKTKHGEDIETLRAELDRTAEVERLQAELAAQSEAMAKLDMDMQRLRMAGEQLLTASTALRETEGGAPEVANLINRAMLAELELLRATRAADMAEAGALLARLEPLLEAKGEATEASEPGTTDGSNVQPLTSGGMN